MTRISNHPRGAFNRAYPDLKKLQCKGLTAMDIELLNKKAEEQANYSTHLSWGDRKECFISGADWLMQQPISERLTEEEMQALCSYFNWEYWDRSFVSDPVLMTRYNRGRLAGIFGADLFNNIPNRQRYDK